MWYLYLDIFLMGESDIRCDYTEKNVFFGIEPTWYLTDILHYYLFSINHLDINRNVVISIF
jgi:hypothetical protein